MEKSVKRFEENPAAGMKPSRFTSRKAFTTDDQTEVNHFFYAAEDESRLAGVWECAPTREEIDAYPVDEMMTILSGSVTVSMDGGMAETFTAGDTFFIPKGTRCVWEITETLRKYYFIAG